MTKGSLGGGMYMYNTADIMPDVVYIRNADISKLYTIAKRRFESMRHERGNKLH